MFMGFGAGKYSVGFHSGFADENSGVSFRRTCYPLSCWTLTLCRSWSECHIILLLVRFSLSSTVMLCNFQSWLVFSFTFPRP